MPQYNLNDVRKAVRDGEVRYHGRKVQRDISNLGYELTEVKNCLLSLTEGDFQKSHDYKGRLFDAYIVDFQSPEDNDVIDKLYVKFCLMDDCLYLHLGSFHLA